MIRPTPPALVPLIAAAAADAGLSASLVEAIVAQESGFDPQAYRYEPAFWRTYLRDKPEWAGAVPEEVSASYGLMQIMFPVACERGFTGLPRQLWEPAVGLRWGCAQVAYLFTWAEHIADLPRSSPLVVEAALAAYNGGKGGNAPDSSPNRNRVYTASVLAKLRVMGTDPESLV